MPVLDNPKHELFAQGIAKGHSQRQSYIDAGYECNSEKSVDESASRLSSDVKVITRIKELQELAAKKSLITIESATQALLRYAEKGEQLAEASGLSVARASIMDAAKLNGLIIDKSESKNTNQNTIVASIILEPLKKEDGLQD